MDRADLSVTGQSNFPFCQPVVLDRRHLPLNFPRPAAGGPLADTFMQPGNLPKWSPKRPGRQTSLSRVTAPRQAKRADRTLCRARIDTTDSSWQVSDARRGIFDVTGQHQPGSVSGTDRALCLRRDVDPVIQLLRLEAAGSEHLSPIKLLSRAYSEHPRVREHRSSARSPGVRGSPRAYGEHITTIPDSSEESDHPRAYGEHSRRSRTRRRSADHPRAYGEHIALLALRGGGPDHPRAYGEPRSRGRARLRRHRITPARTGSTVSERVDLTGGLRITPARTGSTRLVR